MKFRHLISLFFLIGIGFVLQQVVSYSNAWEKFNAQIAVISPIAAEVENVMYEEAGIVQSLVEAEQLNQKLRRLLPEQLQEEQLQEQIGSIAKRHHIKILASKTAIHSRPGYQEATLDMTMEADDARAKRFMRELKSIPRRIHIVPPEKRTKKNIQLAITVYAVSQSTDATFTPPRCIEMPDELLLPPLRDRLAQRHAVYSKQCHFIARYDALYRKQLQLLALQQENSRLQALEQQLRHRL